MEGSEGITLAVKDLSYAVRPRSLLNKFGSRIELLHSVNFIAKPASLTAVLGPSGCGKTTLLNIISSRARGKVTDGSVTFNGNNTSAYKLKGAVALLNANDRLLAYLNVRETLMFTAYLRMPGATREERQSRVDEILDDLALTHAQYTTVGGPWKKGLSSGEMRRCSIAMELMGNPGLLLLDEPTSGLDAVLAFEVISVLKKLAQKGKTIVCTLHQPRSSVCRLIDNVALMAKGYLIFQGTFAEAHSHFLSTMKRDISRQGNYADELLDIANGIEDETDIKAMSDASSLERKTGSHLDRLISAGNSNPQVWQESLSAWMSSDLEARQRLAIMEELGSKREIKVPTSEKNCVKRYFMEIYGVTYRTFRNSWKNPMALIMSILVQASMGVFLGFIFFRLPYKFLPYERPVDIGDPSSPAMKILESPLVRFLSEGVDSQGTNPLLDIIMYGVDGKGSDPIKHLLQTGDPDAFSSVAASSPIIYRLANMIPCVMRRLQLEQTGNYLDVMNMPEYYPAWRSDNLTIDPNSDWKNYGEPIPGTSLDMGNKFVFGEYNPPSIVQSVVQSLQFFDYIFYQLPWKQANDFCSSHALESYVPCFGCHGEIGNFLDAASECTEIPEQPLNIMQVCPQYRDDLIDITGTPNIPTVKVFDANGDFVRNKLGGIIYPADPPVDPSLPTGAPPNAPKRKLQLSGLMGGGIDLSGFVPPVLLDLAAPLERYTDALKDCNHPVCQKLESYITMGGNSEDGSEGTTKSSGSLMDYAAVLGAVLNIAGALFFSVASLGFGAYDGLTGLCQERPLINRELMNHTYKASSFFIGRTIGDFLFHLLPAFCLVTPFYFIIDIDKGPNGLWFAKFLLICLCMSTTAYGFSYFVSSLSPSMEVAVIAAPLALVVLLCCSGFFVRDDAIPSGMTWLKYISFYRWSFFAMILNQFPKDGVYWGVPNSFNLAVIGIGEDSMWKCLGILVALGIAFRILACLGLKYTNRAVGVET